MSEIRMEPPSSSPSTFPLKPPGSGGSLAGGIGHAWLIMVIDELLMPPLASITNNLEAILGSTLLPPVAIIVWGLIQLKGDKPRTGKGLLLGLLSIAAVVLLLVAACFGLLSGNNL